MKLVLAQGNPGNQYSQTRHNFGWLVIDRYAASHNCTFISKPKFKAEIAEISHKNDKILLVKPTTFYNETGQTARSLLDFYKLAPSDLLVVHDEIALKFGTLRIRLGGSPAGNNGIKSLNQHLGDDYWRLRAGIYSPLRDRMPDADFVLSRFSQSEKTDINDLILPACYDLIDEFVSEKLIATSLDVLSENREAVRSNQS